MIYRLIKGIAKFQLLLLLVTGVLGQQAPPTKPSLELEVNGVTFSADWVKLAWGTNLALTMTVETGWEVDSVAIAEVHSDNEAVADASITAAVTKNAP